MSAGSRHPTVPLVGQFAVAHDAAATALAAKVRQVATIAAPAGIPTLRQARVVSSAAGPPPTCTITFDGLINIAGIRYMASYTPTAGDVVELLVRPGNPIILGTLA
jgi:hypothetical protein